MFGEIVHSIEENAEAAVVVNWKTGLEVNADNTKSMVMFRNENASPSHGIKIDNISFENVKKV